MPPNGFEIAKVLTDKSLPLFDASSLWWGLALAVVSIAFSILAWSGMRGLFRPGERGRAILLWAINIFIFILALTMLTKAFPRMSPGLVIGIFFILSIAVAGGTGVAKKKADDAGGKDSKEKK